MSEQEKKQESVSSEKKEKPAKKKDSFFDTARRWLKDLKGELKKVTWPSLKDTVKNVLIVLGCVVVVGVFIWVFDFLARAVIDALLNLFG